MKKLLLLLSLGLLPFALLWAQRSQRDLLPKVNEDGSVTFHLRAPKAVKVEVIGSWGSTLPLTEGENGVWEVTTPPLESDMYFYRFSVDGMIGLDPRNPFTKRDVNTVFSVFYVDGPQADLYKVQDVPHGTVVAQWYHSQATGVDRRMNIYLPPTYDGKKKFPVLYLLHGSGNDEDGWLELGSTARIMDNLIAQGRAVPMIVVMPNGNIGAQAAPGRTKDNLDFYPVGSDRIPNAYADKGITFENSFREIVQWTDRNLCTIPRKDRRAVAGLSMGGGHTFQIAINYPELFDYYGLFSAGFRQLTAEDSDRAFKEFDAGLRNLSKVGYRLYWIEIGKDDFLYERNIRLLRSMDYLGFKYEYTETSGGHSWSNWRKYLSEFAPRLFR